MAATNPFVYGEIVPSEAFADRALILTQGRIIADAPPDAALTETTIARAFCVIPRIDRTGASPRFSFQLEP